MKIKTMMYAVLITTMAIALYFILLPAKKYEPQPQCYGLYLGQNIDGPKIKKAQQDYNKKPCVISTFISWVETPFMNNLKGLNIIKKAGAVPLITLEPWSFPSKEPVPLRDIYEGKEDGVIQAFSLMLQELDSPVMVRFAHEMNGDWYPWSGSNNGNSGSDYIKAYQRVHDVVSRTSPVLRIKWIWSVNSEDVPKEKWNEPMNYYPGDKYVDIVGVDGYNFGRRNFWDRGRSFKRIFKPSLKYLKKNLPHKTVYITEMATSGPDVEKARWIASFMGVFSGEYNFIPMFIWFDLDKEANWAIRSGASGTDAFKYGLQKINNESKNMLWKEND